MLSNLTGADDARFRSTEWPAEVSVFRSKPAWFADLEGLDVFHDAAVWLDVAQQIQSFTTKGILARSEARRRYEAGESVYVLGLDRGVSELREMCRALADDLGLHESAVSVEAWAARGRTHVGLHYDLDFNFNVQIVGNKTWRTAHNRSVVHPVESFHMTMTEPRDGVDPPRETDMTTHRVRPGDVVYLPQGTWHATETEETTFSLAFVVRPPTWAQHVAHVLTERLHAEAPWRARVLGARNAENRDQLLAAAGRVLPAAAQALTSASPDDLVYVASCGGVATIFEWAENVESVRLTGDTLHWTRGGSPLRLTVPSWAARVAEAIASSPRWSLASLQPLVGPDDERWLSAWLLLLASKGLLRSRHA